MPRPVSFSGAADGFVGAPQQWSAASVVFLGYSRGGAEDAEGAGPSYPLTNRTVFVCILRGE